MFWWELIILYKERDNNYWGILLPINLYIYNNAFNDIQKCPQVFTPHWFKLVHPSNFQKEKKKGKKTGAGFKLKKHESCSNLFLSSINQIQIQINKYKIHVYIAKHKYIVFRQKSIDHIIVYYSIRWESCACMQGWNLCTQWATSFFCNWPFISLLLFRSLYILLAIFFWVVTMRLSLYLWFSFI